MKSTIRRIAAATAVSTALLASGNAHAFFGLPGIPGLPCLVDPLCALAPWTQWNNVQLGIGNPLGLDVTQPLPSFSLGAGLSGQYSLRISPSFVVPGSVPAVDELQLILANQRQIIGSSQQGHLSFNAAAGDSYYVMLNGQLRQGQDYQLSLAAVPEPETWAMLLAGLGVVAAAARRKATSGQAEQA